MLKVTFTLGPVFLLLLLAACSHTRTISTGDGTVTVESKGKDAESIHVTGKDGTSVDINSGKPISGYPADVPLYSGKSMMDMKAEEKHSRSVAIQTSDSVQKISDFYKSQLAANGWKTETTMSSDKMVLYTATKDNRQLVVSITSDGNTQTVSQQLADK